ncbi:TPA_asm: hypothetical protein, partial [ssRNA phage Esthiorhiza.2_28]
MLGDPNPLASRFGGPDHTDLGSVSGRMWEEPPPRGSEVLSRALAWEMH